MATDNKSKLARNPFEIFQKEKDKKDVVEVKVKSGGKEKFNHEIPERSAFKRYRDLSEVSIDIAKELIGKQSYNAADIGKLSYKEIRDKGLLFFMANEAGQNRTGLLSLCPALLTGIRLYSEMSESKLKAESKLKIDLLESMKLGIEAVFKFIFRDEDWKNNSDLNPVFDASPYESDAFYSGSDSDGLNGRSYIDSISWATPLFLRIMNLTDNNKFVFNEEYRKISRRLAKWCLSYINSSVLTIDAIDEKDDNKPYQRPVGWSFTKPNSTTKNSRNAASLYFTYAAASMYLSFRDEYEEILDSLQTLNRYHDKKRIKLTESYRVNNFQQVAETTEVYKSTVNFDADDDARKFKLLEDALKVLQNPKNKDKIEDFFDFNKNNEDKDTFAGYNGKIFSVEELKNKKLGAITQLKWNLEKISIDIWEKAKENDRLENNFVYEDFNFNIATPEAIASGGQTSALFAGLLHISICLYSAYDLVVRWTDEDEDESGRFGEKAYDDMQNTMLLHVQRTQRFYDKLAEKGRAYGVEFLTLRFGEEYSDDPDKNGNLTDREVVEKLRKQSINITSIVPMLLKTNNLISQYVVQYPQKQMSESLARIGEKRFYDREKATKDENDKYRWFWESDGYHAMSNYYYVGAIFDFYKYYREYEFEYIERYEKLRETLVKDLNFSDSVREFYQLVAEEKTILEKEYEEKLKAKDNEIAEKEAKMRKSEIGDMLVSNINYIVESSDYFDKPEFYARLIGGLRNHLAKELVERYAKNPAEDKEILEKLAVPSTPKSDALISLLQALAADIILPSAIEARTEVTGTVNDLGRDKLQGVMPATFALKGGKQLINDGLIEKMFAKMCETLVWKDQKK
jgi:hypothetical protein